MAYTHTTFSALKTALANRLGDAGGVYWLNGANGAISDELGLYIIEALRTWGLFTGYWRDTAAAATTANTPFYSISSLTNGGGTPLLSYTVTDKDLAARIQYHLLEPATGSSWTGSEQFTYTDVIGALQRRRDALLIETGAVITHTTQALGAGSQTFTVPDTTLAIRRLAWTSARGVTWPVYPEDINSQRSYGTGFLTTQGIPATYSSSSAQPLTYVIAPPPNEPGTLDMLLVQSGAALTGTGIPLGIPDDMSSIVKWGALADILGKEGPAQDLARSYFCERRWKLGIEAAKLYPTIINATINGIATSPDTVSQLDMYNLNWQSNTGTPEFVISLRNMVGLAPCPDAVYGVSFDVVCKAPIPATDGDFIQLGREYIDPLLDYAEHLAAFKSGGYEFRHTLRGANNFFQAALKYNQRLAAQTPAIKNLIQQSTDDDYVLRRDRPVDNRPLQAVTQISNESDQLKQLYQ